MVQPLVFMVCLLCSWALTHSAVTNSKHNHPKILDLVTKRGYPSETHQVTTSDGYILTMFRIPHGKTTKHISNKPVFLQHGLISCSDMFLMPEATHGLGYILADNDYDVWIGNSRGNKYSRNHTSLNPDKDSKFWNFSWHEMGMFDLPAMIDYILNITNQTKLHYVGHSQGTTAFYVLATTRPEYNSKIKAQISLAPVAYMNHTPSPGVRRIASSFNRVKRLAEMLQINELASDQQFMTKAFKALCRLFPIECSNVVFSTIGFNLYTSNTNASILLGFLPAGGSIRQTLHFLQEINSKCFRWYDYEENNLEVYGRVKPPVYNLSLVTSPSYLFHSRGDGVIGTKDVFRLCRKIRGACLGLFLIPDDDFAHTDFVFGVKAPELVYQKLLSVMQKH